MKHPNSLHPFAARMLAAKQAKQAEREAAKIVPLIPKAPAAPAPEKRAFAPVRKPEPVSKGILTQIVPEIPKP